MPAIQCSNGKWKWGAFGNCVHATKEDAEKAGIAIRIKEREK